MAFLLQEDGSSRIQLEGGTDLLLLEGLLAQTLAATSTFVVAMSRRVNFALTVLSTFTSRVVKQMSRVLAASGTFTAGVLRAYSVLLQVAGIFAPAFRRTVRLGVALTSTFTAFLAKIPPSVTQFLSLSALSSFTTGVKTNRIYKVLVALSGVFTSFVAPKKFTKIRGSRRPRGVPRGVAIGSRSRKVFWK